MCTRTCLVEVKETIFSRIKTLTGNYRTKVIAVSEKKKKTPTINSTKHGILYDKNFKDYNFEVIPRLACLYHTGLDIYNVLLLAV